MKNIGLNSTNRLLDWLKAFVIALVLILIVKHFFFAPVIVDGHSMQPTLHDRDRLIVNKTSYFFKQPARFDIIVFRSSNEHDYIKRVIGLPGEHVQAVNNTLYVNDEPIDEPFLQYKADATISFPIITNDFTLENLHGHYDIIPDDYYLVLGDNRTGSKDSRDIGLIHKNDIIGKADIIYWPLNRMKVNP